MAVDHLRWFKRKKYGYGWTPCTWQGWLVILVYGLGLYMLVVRLLPETSASSPVQFLLAVTIWTVLLLVITYRTGDPPRWQWGDVDSEDKSEKL
jgi:hypothetical protein